MSFVFDARNHIYTLDDEVIPSVTGILADCGLIDATWFTEESRQRGKFAHQACWLYVREVLDEDSIDPALRGYFTSFRRAWDKRIPRKVIAEEPNYHRFQKYGGTIDLEIPDDPEIIDYKTGAKSKWHPLQTAGYAGMAQSWHEGKPIIQYKRSAWYLKADGSYPDIVQHKSAIDFNNFYSCLNVYRMKRGHFS